MARYKPMGRMDDPILTDGDRGFRGIDSYLEPTTLQGGTVEASENMRLEGDIASVRKGIEFKAGAVTLTYAGDERYLHPPYFPILSQGQNLSPVPQRIKSSYGTIRITAV